MSVLSTEKLNFIKNTINDGKPRLNIDNVNSYSFIFNVIKFDIQFYREPN